MDLAAGVLAKRISHGRATTVAIHSMSFLRPVQVGSAVSCYAQLIKQGRTSMTIAVEVWVEVLASAEKYRVTEGTFIFVAIDEAGCPREVPRSA